MNPSIPNSPSNEPQNGFLLLRLRTAGIALPVQGGRVTVTPLTDSDHEASDPFPITLISDASGNTPTVSLPSVSPSASLSPSTEPVSTRYRIDVEADGFEPVRILGLPIYPGVTSVQTLSLLPLPGIGREQIIPQAPSPDL